MNEELFNRFDSLTFDDVLIVPGYTEVLPNETDVQSPTHAEYSTQHPHPLSCNGHSHRSADWQLRWRVKADLASSIATCRRKSKPPKWKRSNVRNLA